MRIYQYGPLLGNVHTLSLIKKANAGDNWPHLVVFGGVMGTGKSTVAEISALYGTCEHPDKIKVEPCLKCATCLKNLEALKTTGKSSQIVKKNMGYIGTDTKKMDELIKEIFLYKAGLGRKYYILEEFHLLSQHNQGSLLEEFARLDENAYVIVCTTRMKEILPELVDRGIPFTFTHLTRAESMILLDRECKRYRLPSPTPDEEQYILRACRDIPRTIVNTVEFLANTNPTPEELQAFLGYIGHEVFLEVFSNAADSRYYFTLLDKLLKSYNYELVYEQLQEFVMNWMFAVEGEIYDLFPKSSVESLRVLDFKILRKIREAIKSYPRTSSDVQMMFWDIKFLLTPKISEGSRVAAQAQYANSNAEVISNNSAPSSVLTPFNPKRRNLNGSPTA